MTAVNWRNVALKRTGDGTRPVHQRRPLLRWAGLAGSLPALALEGRSDLFERTPPPSPGATGPGGYQVPSIPPLIPSTLITGDSIIGSVRLINAVTHFPQSFRSHGLHNSGKTPRAHPLTLVFYEKDTQESEITMGDFNHIFYLIFLIFKKVESYFLSLGQRQQWAAVTGVSADSLASTPGSSMPSGPTVFILVTILICSGNVQHFLRVMAFTQTLTAHST